MTHWIQQEPKIFQISMFPFISYIFGVNYTDSSFRGYTLALKNLLTEDTWGELKCYPFLIKVIAAVNPFHLILNVFF